LIDKVIYPDYVLCYNPRTDKEQSFKVTYELEVLDTSKGKVKVKAIDFTSTDVIAKDPKNKQGIIDFMRDKWVNKSEIELIVDESEIYKQRFVSFNLKLMISISLTFWLSIDLFVFYQKK